MCKVNNAVFLVLTFWSRSFGQQLKAKLYIGQKRVTYVSWNNILRPQNIQNLCIKRKCNSLQAVKMSTFVTNVTRKQSCFRNVCFVTYISYDISKLGSLPNPKKADQCICKKIRLESCPVLLPIYDDQQAVLCTYICLFVQLLKKCSSSWSTFDNDSRRVFRHHIQPIYIITA
jgi:hypothetical protein